MINHLLPLNSPTVPNRESGVSLCAPCRNRTYNLMIKSQLQLVRSGFVGGLNPSSALLCAPLSSDHPAVSGRFSPPNSPTIVYNAGGIS